MQHWTPDDESLAEQAPPRDVWVAWLNRPPLHDVEPPAAPKEGRAAGAMVALTVLGFWGGVAAICVSRFA